MSIYISGVEMPKEHPLYITLRPDGSVHVWDSYDGDSYKAQAIYVPDHGDLIERDKLRNIMFIGEQCLYSWDEIEDAINYAPAVIPASKEEPT